MNAPIDLPAGCEHGTHGGYRRGCRCEPCSTIVARYRKRWKYDRDHGHERTVDVEPVRAHLRDLLAAGMTPGQIAEAAHLSTRRRVWQILNVDTTRRLRRDAAERILAVRPGTMPDAADPECEAFVPAEPTRRRIRALLALGWPHAEIQARSGVRSHVLLHQAGECVTLRNHLRIRDVYDELCMTPGPSQATRQRAAKRGYPPPLAWDDVDIDDVQASPAVVVDDEPDLVDEVVVDRLVRGENWRRIGATRAERIAAAEILDSRHFTRERQAELGWSEQAIDAIGWGRAAIERHLGLSSGRDFAVKAQAQQEAS